MLQKIQDGLESLLARITLSEENLNKLNKNLATLSDQLSNYIKNNTIINKKVITLKKKKKIIELE